MRKDPALASSRSAVFATMMVLSAMTACNKKDAPNGGLVLPDPGNGTPTAGGVPTSTIGGARLACRRNSDCPTPLVCRYLPGEGSFCNVQCREDRDCAPGFICRSDQCVPAGSAEICDGVDNTGDGRVDEGFDLAGDPKNCGRCGTSCDRAIAHAATGGTTCVAGVCQLITCADGFANTNGLLSDGCEYGCFRTNGGIEISDGDDNDCDGAVDEGFECTFGEPDRSCGSGVGACSPGVQRCRPDGVWSACEGATGPTVTELCNGIDDNCDRSVDEGFSLTTDVRNCGRCGNDCAQRMPNANVACSEGRCEFRGCVLNAMNLDHDATNGCEMCPVIPVRTEVCGNFLDDNCDGAIDNGCVCTLGELRPCGLPDRNRDGMPDWELDGVGRCRMGHQLCVAGTAEEMGTLWAACESAVPPAAMESCNGIDDTCSGVVPANESDADRDGYRICDGDCNDRDRFVNPAQFETCNGVDDDCDGSVDEDFFVGFPCRGIGACPDGQYECASLFLSQCSTDPDGSRYPIPTPVEMCNRVDDDCDRVVDNAPASVVASDAQNCGACGNVCAFPNAAAACVRAQCVRGPCASGFVDADQNSGNGCEYQCTPTADTTDGPTRQCDGIDNDCDGSVDEGCTCQDGTRLICGPPAPSCNTMTQTCRGECRLGTQTCVGGVQGPCVGAVSQTTELCNRRDDDCSGALPFNERDGDMDGYPPCEGDCNDTNPNVRPGMPELCDGIDNNCSGQTDEGFFIGVPCRGIGACGIGAYECAGRTAFRCSTDITGSQYPNPAPAETCENLQDDDCDGSVDEGCVCTPGDRRPCGVPPALNGVGICHVGLQECLVTRVWDVCVGAQDRRMETCNGLDDDCDTRTDEDFDLMTDPAHCGRCDNDCGMLANVQSASCANGTCAALMCRPGWNNVDGRTDNGCEYGCFLTAGGVEQCDRIDNDCDGQVDDGVNCPP